MADKINNILQKEEALEKAGVSRFKAFAIIAEAYDAFKEVETVVNGTIKTEKVPDIRRREWAVEMTAKLMGDMIERKEIEHELGDKTLEKYSDLSASELKRRALELATRFN